MKTARSDKWVRAYVGDTAVVDSRDALLFWEERFPVPSYAFPTDDVRTDLLRPSSTEPTTRSFYTPKGPVSAWFDLEVGQRVIEHAAWVREDPAVSDRIVLTWEPGELDRWLEEDEEVIEHPRDPYTRVEALRSSRHLVVSRDGITLGDSRRPVLLFETGLPTRYYLPREDVDVRALEESANRTRCPYKGTAEEYWSLPGVEDGENIAWSYAEPLPAVATIAGRIAFYNEIVDITVDGEPQARPRSVFSTKGNRPTSP